ncbi:ComF operon protein A [Paenibacillus pini JCM 16418]|uniref:ComF operon protein A n=1 Tax=Paenibacillus pini JCM 16418 TaxID=1236976 RepID=W7Z118_9BACL|nr:ComF operon protein A [Paenibacillus pini JCM 16418]
MIFPLLDSVLSAQGRVLVATPRRDVVLELAPRLAKAFESTSLVALYGGSTERWQSGGITLATTHQLIRFYQTFDLVVIDELDAFPYHNDPMLLLLRSRPANQKAGLYTYQLPRHVPYRRKSRGEHLSMLKFLFDFTVTPCQYPSELR